MSKKLRSFHKLFFIIIFSFLFSSIIGSGNTPDLPDRIAPELEQIEALPRRKKPAELNIEVTKIKSELLEEVYIDKQNKNIYVDFSKKREQTLRGVKSAEDLEKKYKVIVSENVQGSSEVNGRKKAVNKMASQTMNYEVVDYQGKKVLKIPYENEPNKLYISIQESGNEKIFKIYGIDVNNAHNVEKTVVERKEVTVTVNYINGSAQQWIGFKSDGGDIQSTSGSQVELYKHNFTEGFINGFNNLKCNNNTHTHATPHSTITVSGPSVVGGTETSKLAAGSGYVYQNIDIKTPEYKGNDKNIQLRYYCNPASNGVALHILLKTIPPAGSGYRFYIKHTNPDGSIKEHILNIGDRYEIEEKEASIYLNGEKNKDITFDSNGISSNPNVTIEKHNFTNGFLTGFKYENCQTGVNHNIEITGKDVSRVEKPDHSNTSDRYQKLNILTFINGHYEYTYITFFCNGEKIVINSNLSSVTTLNITHTNGSKVKKHRLNIYSSKSGVEREATLKPYEIEDNENLNVQLREFFTFDGFVRIKMPLIPKNNSEWYIPALALGNKNDTNGWIESGSWNSNRNSIVAKYQTKYQNKIDVQTGFNKESMLDKDFIKKNDEGIPTVIGRREKPNSGNEVEIKTKLIGKITLNSEFQNIIENFRQSNDSEIEFLPVDEEQINIVIGSSTANSSKVYLPSDIQSETPVVNEKYPNIILKRPPLEKENVTLELTNKMVEQPIQFSESMSSNPDYTINSDIRRYLKSLWYKSTVILNENNYKEIEISEDGNSEKSFVELISSNGKKLKLDIQYVNKYPKITIKSGSQEGIYNLKINHYNYGGINRNNTKFIKVKGKEYILEINYRSPDVDDNLMEITYNNSTPVEIVDDENIKGVNSLEVNFNSNVGLKQKTGVNWINYKPFPVIAIGKELPKNEAGWATEHRYSGDHITRTRENSNSRFRSQNNIEFSAPVYFTDTKSNDAIEVKGVDSSNRINVFGGFKTNALETISAKLKSNIQLEAILNKIRKERAVNHEFEPIDPVNEQLTFIRGQEIVYIFQSKVLEFPVESDRNGHKGLKKSFKFPNIKIIKPIINEEMKLNIDLKFNLSDSLIFSESGMNQVTGVTFIPEQSKRNLRGLHFDSIFKVSGGSQNGKEITNGNSLKENFKIINNGNELIGEIEYKNNHPVIKILNSPKKGEYVLKITHHEESGLARITYNLTINILEDFKQPDFTVKSNVDEIIIRKSGDKYTVDIPNVWVEMIQNSKDSNIFPLITINSPTKWEMSTQHPLNPIDKKPLVLFDLNNNNEATRGFINIRETPYQNLEKFFIYQVGEMTNRNLGVGAYTKIAEKGDSNKVKVTYEMNLSKEVLDKIWAFAEKNSELKVEIPYHSNMVTRFHAVKGIISDGKFHISEKNIIEEIEVPKVYVIKDGYKIPENTVDLEFKNPVPKSEYGLKGTFDINGTIGLKLPNNMPKELDHPASLNIEKTSNGNGYTLIKSYHEIDVYTLKGGVEKKIGTITTDTSGHLKDTIRVSNGDSYTYVLKKGKDSPVAIGLEKWDLNTSGLVESLLLKHKNSNGDIQGVDRYNIKIEPFNILTYLKHPAPITTLEKNIETGTTRVPLGEFQLHNYDKKITEKDGQEVKIRVMKPSVTPNIISGTLLFSGNKDSITSPNEVDELEFNVTNGSIADGSTYRLTNGTNPVIEIVRGDIRASVVKEIVIKGTPIGSDAKFPYMNVKANLKNIIISDEDSIETTGYSMGNVSLQQNGSAPSSSDKFTNYTFPSIAVGKGWGVINSSSKDYINSKLDNQISYYFEGDSSLRETIEVFLDEIERNKNYIYQQKINNNGKIAVAGTVGKSGVKDEKITGDIKFSIPESILEKARSIKGNRVVLKNSNDKITFVHSRVKEDSGDKFYLPTDNSNVTPKTYEMNYKNIVIEKKYYTKNLALKFLKDYNGEEITLTKTGITLPNTNVEKLIYEPGVLSKLGFKNTIKITPLDNTVIEGTTEYETDDKGNLASTVILNLSKNGAKATLILAYESDRVKAKLTNIEGKETFSIELDHIEASGDTRRTYNLTFITSKEIIDTTYHWGEMDLLISSRYDPIDGQINSEPLLIGENGIKYPNQALLLELKKGDLPKWPGIDKVVKINGVPINKGETKEISLNSGAITLKITQETNGDIKIKPVKWNYNSNAEFILDYEQNGKIENKYNFNLKSPEFFVASSGVLDFGKVYKVGNVSDKTVTTNIELEYKEGGVKAKYTLDVAHEGLGGLVNKLYLNDEKTLLVKDLKLGSEEGKGTTKRILPLTGTLDGKSVEKTKEGIYQKTIQIMIHLQ